MSGSAGDSSEREPLLANKQRGAAVLVSINSSSSSDEYASADPALPGSSTPHDAAPPSSDPSGTSDSKDKDKDKDKQNQVPFFKLFRFADGIDWAFILVGTFGAFVGGVALPFYSYFFGDVVDIFGDFIRGNITESELKSEILTYTYYYMGLAGGIFMAGWVQMALWIWTSERQARRIRIKYLTSILRQDIGWFDSEQSGGIAARIASDTQLVQDGIGEKVGMFVQAIAAFIASFVVGFIRGWKLTLVLLSVTPLIVVSTGILGYFMQNLTNEGQTIYAAAGAAAEEAISSIRTVIAFSGEKRESNRYAKKLVSACKNGIKKAHLSGLSVGFLFLIIFGSYSLAFWYGSTLILDGSLSAGDITATFFAVLIGAFSLGGASPAVSAFASAKGAAYKMFQVIDRIAPIDSLSTAGEKPARVEGSVEFRNVAFAYPTRPDVPILRDFSLNIEPSRTVALVGSSGCGKSTSVALLQRFYDTLGGQVLVDGLDVKQWNVGYLRSQIGVVSQEPILFNDSIFNNVAQGKTTTFDEEDLEKDEESSRQLFTATMEEVVAACKLSNAHDFIVTLPDGYNTIVGDRGIQLSGGQKQRVAIARALIRNPRILLLDEATSALDTESERIVQAALDKASKGRTTIVIAHRLSTIRNADMIAVVNKGVVIETGTHDELMRLAGGFYANLVSKQMMRASAVANQLQGDGSSSGAELSEVDLRDVLKSEQDEASEAKQPLRLDIQKARAGGSASGPSKRTPGSAGAGAQSASPHFSRQKSVTSGSGGRDYEALKDEDLGDGYEAENDDDGKVAPPVSYSRIYSYHRPEALIVLVGFVTSAINGGVFPAFSYIFSEIINVFNETGDDLKNDALFWCYMFLAIAGGSFLSNYLASLMFGIAEEKLTMRLRQLCFDNILRQDVAFFDKEEHSTGILTTRLATDATLVKGLSGSRAALFVQCGVSLVSGLVIAFASGWKLTLVILACMPLLVVGVYMQMKTMSGFSADSAKNYQKSGQVGTEAIQSIRTVTSLNNQRRFLRKYKEYLKKPYILGVKKAVVAGIGFGVAQAAQVIVDGIAFYYGSVLVGNGELDFLQMMKIYSAVTFSFTAIGQAASFMSDVAKAKTAAARVFELIDAKSAIDPTSPSGSKLLDAKGSVHFDKVGFHYPSRPDIEILKGLSFDVPTQKTLAIVGPSGCGKSTVVSLLERFYDPQSGTISFDSVPSQQLHLTSYRHLLGYVGQEPILFNATLRENIAYGLLSSEDYQSGERDAVGENVSLDEIVAVAKAANIHDFIMTLPDKYDTMAGEKGSKLSGGQKQRVAIARALLRSPKLLLLDEATSALDAESEKVVQAALDRAAIGRTTIIIAHRLSTIQNANMIIALKDGVVAERGTHDELMAIENGVYKSLVSKQLQQVTH